MTASLSHRSLAGGGYHAARRGDLRVVYHIDDGDGTVVIVTINHRADVYRRR